MRFSIITVCLNAGDDLSSSVASFLEQTYQDFEVVIKDGLSTDGSVEKLPADDRIKIIRKKDASIYDAMNQGAKASSGDYLLFINAGDRLYTPNTLEDIAKQIDCGGENFYYGRGYNQAQGLYTNSPQKLTPFFCYRSMICHQAMIFPRACFDKHEYDTSYLVSADREYLCWLVLKSKLKCQYIPEIIVWYKAGGFCESPKARAALKEEGVRLQKQHFSPLCRFWYRIRLAVTLPHLRKLIVSNPKLKNYYLRIVAKLYGNDSRPKK